MSTTIIWPETEYDVQYGEKRSYPAVSIYPDGTVYVNAAATRKGFNPLRVDIGHTPDRRYLVLREAQQMYLGYSTNNSKGVQGFTLNRHALHNVEWFKDLRGMKFHAELRVDGMLYIDLAHPLERKEN